MREACVLVGSGPSMQKFRALRQAARDRDLHVVAVCPTPHLTRLSRVLRSEGTDKDTTLLTFSNQDEMYARLLGVVPERFAARALVPTNESATKRSDQR